MGKLTPQVGLEPTTNRLTADRSTTELLKIFYIIILYIFILEKTSIFKVFKPTALISKSITKIISINIPN